MIHTFPQSQNQGQIQTCLHCAGTGHCSMLHQFYRRPDQFLPRRQEASCLICRNKAGIPEHRQYGLVVCHVCQGKGLVWVGPEMFGHV